MGLNQAYQLDDLDLQILDILIKDCRTPYLEIARLCHVSGGTIHVRMKKMEELGIIKGTKILLNLQWNILSPTTITTSRRLMSHPQTLTLRRILLSMKRLIS